MVDRLACPNSSWTLRRSAPLLRRSVAKLWRKLWGLTGLFMPASFALFLTIRLMASALRALPLVERKRTSLHDLLDCKLGLDVVM